MRLLIIQDILYDQKDKVKTTDKGDCKKFNKLSEKGLSNPLRPLSMPFKAFICTLVPYFEHQ